MSIDSKEPWDEEESDEENHESDEDDEPIWKKEYLSTEEVRMFEKTEAQLEGFYEEIGTISKKKPEDAINKFKLGFINQMLNRANELLGIDYRPFPDFEQFDPDVVPTASDVVTMLSQYLRSMDKFRRDYTYAEYQTYYWRVTNSSKKIRAKAPKNFER